jgi:glycerol-3-phosphate acyltransferase PlsY
MADFQILALIILAYLSGGIPTGYLLVRRFYGYDIRTRGSGNPGTANVYRNAGWKAGAATLAVDALKGFAPVLLAERTFPHLPGVAIAAGAAAVVGHNWTIFLRFKGGKGVATSAGVFSALMPLPMLAAAAVFLLSAKMSGHISVGSMAAAASLPVAGFFMGAPPTFTAAAVVAAGLILFKHSSNIRRLLENRELGIHGPSA